MRRQRPLGTVIWSDTFMHNVLRAAAAGIVWSVFYVILWLSGSEIGAEGINTMIMAPVLIPLLWLIILFPGGLFFNLLSGWGVPVVGLFSYAGAIIVAPGDPILYILNKYKSSWVLLDTPPMLAFTYAIFVHEDDSLKSSI